MASIIMQSFGFFWVYLILNSLQIKHSIDIIIIDEKDINTIIAVIDLKLKIKLSQIKYMNWFEFIDFQILCNFRK